MNTVPNNFELNNPAIVEEVTQLFEAYEEALISKNIDVLDNTFWDNTHTIRYAMHENGYGFKSIHQHRVDRKIGPGLKETRRRLEILTLGENFATINLEFKVRDQDEVGRQSQTWVKFPGLGWKVVAAHVSIQDKTSRW